MEKQPTKRELEEQMERTRESLAETIGEIKETVSHEVTTAKKAVTGVLDYREEFQKEPLVWSLGALSAGFALGYTLGYAHKNGKRGKQTAAFAFADSMADELSTIGKGLVMPALDAKIKELFGFEFSEMLDQLSSSHMKRASKKKPKRLPAKTIKRSATRKKAN
ncbi:MAG TPA: hypothetical protein VJT50_16205 [Pyrinomonadaceae bacterium]|nr:hypothetical protein [Pyrinomonadaceae bacterium]